MPRKSIFGKSLLVPFSTEDAEEVEEIAKLNQMPTTSIVRVALKYGIKMLRNEGVIKLRFPEDSKKEVKVV